MPNTENNYLDRVFQTATPEDIIEILKHDAYFVRDLTFEQCQKAIADIQRRINASLRRDEDTDEDDSIEDLSSEPSEGLTDEGRAKLEQVFTQLLNIAAKKSTSSTAREPLAPKSLPYQQLKQAITDLDVDKVAKFVRLYDIENVDPAAPASSSAAPEHRLLTRAKAQYQDLKARGDIAKAVASAKIVALLANDPNQIEIHHYLEQAIFEFDPGLISHLRDQKEALALALIPLHPNRTEADIEFLWRQAANAVSPALRQAFVQHITTASSTHTSDEITTQRNNTFFAALHNNEAETVKTMLRASRNLLDAVVGSNNVKLRAAIQIILDNSNPANMAKTVIAHINTLPLAEAKAIVNFQSSDGNTALSTAIASLQNDPVKAAAVIQHLLQTKGIDVEQPLTIDGTNTNAFVLATERLLAQSNNPQVSQAWLALVNKLSQNPNDDVAKTQRSTVFTQLVQRYDAATTPQQKDSLATAITQLAPYIDPNDLEGSEIFTLVNSFLTRVNSSSTQSIAESNLHTATYRLIGSNVNLKTLKNARGLNILLGAQGHQGLLHLAARAGEEDRVQAIIAKAKEIHAAQPSSSTAPVAALNFLTADTDGVTPLHLAAESGNRSLIDLLLQEAGDDTSEKKKQRLENHLTTHTNPLSLLDYAVLGAAKRSSANQAQDKALFDYLSSQGVDKTLDETQAKLALSEAFKQQRTDIAEYIVTTQSYDFHQELTQALEQATIHNNQASISWLLTSDKTEGAFHDLSEETINTLLNDARFKTNPSYRQSLLRHDGILLNASPEVLDDIINTSDETVIAELDTYKTKHTAIGHALERHTNKALQDYLDESDPTQRLSETDIKQILDEQDDLQTAALLKHALENHDIATAKQIIESEFDIEETQNLVLRHLSYIDPDEADNIVEAISLLQSLNTRADLTDMDPRSLSDDIGIWFTALCHQVDSNDTSEQDIQAAVICLSKLYPSLIDTTSEGLDVLPAALEDLHNAQANDQPGYKANISHLTQALLARHITLKEKAAPSASIIDEIRTIEIDIFTAAAVAASIDQKDIAIELYRSIYQHQFDPNNNPPNFRMDETNPPDELQSTKQRVQALWDEVCASIYNDLNDLSPNLDNIPSHGQAQQLRALHFAFGGAKELVNASMTKTLIEHPDASGLHRLLVDLQLNGESLRKKSTDGKYTAAPRAIYQAAIEAARLAVIQKTAKSQLPTSDATAADILRTDKAVEAAENKAYIDFATQHAQILHERLAAIDSSQDALAALNNLAAATDEPSYQEQYLLSVALKNDDAAVLATLLSVKPTLLNTTFQRKFSVLSYALLNAPPSSNGYGGINSNCINLLLNIPQLTRNDLMYGLGSLIDAIPVNADSENNHLYILEHALATCQLLDKTMLDELSEYAKKQKKLCASKLLNDPDLLAKARQRKLLTDDNQTIASATVTLFNGQRQSNPNETQRCDKIRKHMLVTIRNTASAQHSTTLKHESQLKDIIASTDYHLPGFGSIERKSLTTRTSGNIIESVERLECRPQANSGAPKQATITTSINTNTKTATSNIRGNLSMEQSAKLLAQHFKTLASQELKQADVYSDNSEVPNSKMTQAQIDALPFYRVIFKLTYANDQELASLAETYVDEKVFPILTKTELATIAKVMPDAKLNDFKAKYAAMEQQYLDHKAGTLARNNPLSHPGAARLIRQVEKMRTAADYNFGATDSVMPHLTKPAPSATQPSPPASSSPPAQSSAPAQSSPPMQSSPPVPGSSGPRSGP